MGQRFKSFGNGTFEKRGGVFRGQETGYITCDGLGMVAVGRVWVARVGKD